VLNFIGILWRENMKNCTGNDLGNGKGLMGISSDEGNYLIRK